MCGGVYEDELAMERGLNKCDLNLGDQVVGIFGATIPMWHGAIVGLEMTSQGVAVDIMWNDGSITEIMEYDLRNEKALERALMGTQVGSPIGYYLANETELV
jgi:hypothetical protein